MKYRYTILTYNFNNYEILHEIENPQDDVEYVYVTDDPNIKSNTWKIIVDKSLKDMSPFDKCYTVRFNPFKYCSTDICIRIDGSIIVKSSPDKLIEKFNNEGHNLALCPHPLRHSLIDEYNTWINSRHHSLDQAQKCVNYMISRNYNFNYKSMIQENIVIQRKCKQNDDIDRMTYALLKYLGSENEIERIDQIITSYILNTHFANIKIMPLSESFIHSYIFEWCCHGTSFPIYGFNFKPNEIANPGFYKAYLFNELIDLVKPEDL